MAEMLAYARYRAECNDEKSVLIFITMPKPVFSHVRVCVR